MLVRGADFGNCKSAILQIVPLFALAQTLAALQT
jgi:hypothetical protein